MEGLPLCGKTLRTQGTSVVDGAHGHVTSVAGNFDGIILHNVLLKDGIAADLKLGLIARMSIEIGLREETIVAGNMLRDLCCSYRKLIIHVFVLLSMSWENFAGLMSVGTHSARILGVEEASLA